MCVHQTGTVPCFAAPTTAVLDRFWSRPQDAEAKVTLTVAINASIYACRGTFQSIVSIKSPLARTRAALTARLDPEYLATGVIHLDDGALHRQNS